MASNDSLKKIRKRAKELQGKNKSLKWIPAIKQASRQLKSEGAFGKSTPKVKKRKAKKSSGTKKRRPASSGISRKSKIVPRKRVGLMPWEKMAKQWTKSARQHNLKQEAEMKYAQACLALEKAKTIKATKVAIKTKNKWRNVLKALNK